MIDAFIFWRLAHPIAASAFIQEDTSLTSSLLDVLAVALLALALGAFFFYGRSRQSTPVKGGVPKASQRKVSALAGVAIIVPVVWFLLVWTGTSILHASISPTPGLTPHPSVPPAHNPTPSSPNALAHDLVTPGVLTVGTDPSFPPQEFTDPQTHQLAGFDIDLITAIAQKMHLREKTMSITKYQSLFDDLRASKLDVVISAINMDDPNIANFEFVPYFNASESLLVQAGNPKKIKQLTDLCGTSVGVQGGSREQAELNSANTQCQQNGKTAMTITSVATEEAVLQLLLQRAVDVTYQDTSAADYYMVMPPYAGKFAPAGMIQAPPEGIVIRMGDTIMLSAVENAFDALKKDGTYHKLFVKWHLTSMEELAVVDRSLWYV